MDEQKLIQDPSQKVLAMYQAVIEFINEGCDINTLKVADITGRAGIGKGTAYEYFSSKEEIISSAILYYVKVCFEKLQVISTDNRTFQQKINEVMDFIDEHVKEKQGAFFLIKMVLESYAHTHLSDSLVSRMIPIPFLSGKRHPAFLLHAHQ